MRAAGFVLAGGRSRRMGLDKAMMRMGAGTLLEHALGVVRAACGEAAIAGDREDLAVFARVVPDEHKDCGPLAGIHAALRQTQTEWNVFLAVDMPRVEAEHLRRLMEAERGPETLAVAAQAGGRLQPLCAMYHRSLAEAVGRALESGERAVWRVVEGGTGLVRVEFGDEGTFSNVNTPEDAAGLE